MVEMGLDRGYGGEGGLVGGRMRRGEKREGGKKKNDEIH